MANGQIRLGPEILLANGVKKLVGEPVAPPRGTHRAIGRGGGGG